MRILITGAQGQLGCELQRVLRTGKAEIGPIPSAYVGSSVTATNSTELDITDSDAVDVIVAQGFDLVINCAAYTNVDGCETNPEAAWAVNAQGPANLAAACRRSGAKLVHISTDYVFQGSSAEPRTEDDDTHPISAYGRTKLAGELAVQSICPNSAIVRTAWLYGYSGKNFVKTMRRLGQSHSRVTVVNDQLGNPTNANDLAYEVLQIAQNGNAGVYHCTGKGTCSWADFASAIMQGFGLDCKVVPVTTAQYRAANPGTAARPAFSSLRNAHLESTIGDQMRPWHDALSCYVQHFDELEG